MNRPTVVILRALLTQFGGAEQTASLTAVALCKRGFRVVYQAGVPLDPAHPYYTRLRDAGIGVLVQPDLRTRGTARALLLALRPIAWPLYAALRGKSLARAWSDMRAIIDHLLARTEQWVFTSRLARLRRAGPLVVHIFGPESLTAHAVRAGQALDFPVVYTETTEADEVSTERFQLKWSLPALPHVAAATCCSPLIAANMRRVYGYAGPLEEIPFLIEEPRPTAPHPRSAHLTLGCVGRLVEHKGFQFVIDALAALRKRGRDVALVIAGDGPMRERLESLAIERGVADHVEVLGRFSHVSEVMSRIDVLVLPSSSEAQPLAITEAMSYGKAVVASRFGGIPDLVEEGRSGLLVEPGDHAGLVAALERLALDPILVAALGERGRQRFLAERSESAVVQKLEGLYLRVLA